MRSLVGANRTCLYAALCVEPELTRWDTVLYHLRTKFEAERVITLSCERDLDGAPRTGGGL